MSEPLTEEFENHQTDLTDLMDKKTTDPDDLLPRFEPEIPTNAETPSAKFRAANPFLVQIPPLGPLPEVSIDGGEGSEQNLSPTQNTAQMVARLAARIGIASFPPEEDNTSTLPSPKPEFDSYIPPVLDPKNQK
jgi:hypothetical protein